MKIKDIPVPSPFEHKGIKFTFRTLPERVSDLNQLPAMCLSVMVFDQIPGMATQSEFRLYVSVERCGEMEDLDVSEEVLEQRSEIASGHLIRHLQESYGIGMSAMAEPPVGAMSDEYTIANLLSMVYQDVSVITNTHAGDRLTIYYDPVAQMRGISARVYGPGRWQIVTYTCPDHLVVPYAIFCLNGTIRIGDTSKRQTFSLTNHRSIQPILPELIVEQWLDEDVIADTINKMYRFLYENNQPLAYEARWTDTYANLSRQVEIEIDRRSYELE